MEVKPRAAIILTRYILRHRVNRPMTLKRNRQQLEELKDTLAGYLTIIEDALKKCTLSNADAQKFLAAWDTYLKLSVLLHNEDSAPTAVIAVVEDLMGWAESNVVNERTRSQLGTGLICHLLRLCSNMISMGLCDMNFVGHVVELCGKVISYGWLINEMITRRESGFMVCFVLIHFQKVRLSLLFRKCGQYCRKLRIGPPSNYPKTPKRVPLEILVPMTTASSL